MTRLRWATVTAVEGQRPGALELGVLVDGEGGAASAVAYPQLVGPVTTGDRVLLNTTAVALGLGTGGWHFVVWVDNADGDGGSTGGRSGHVMKLRYTPHQVRVLTVEEVDSPHHATMAGASSLDGLPVVWTPLHSMLGPVAAGARAAGADRIVYVMTDGASLPAAFSRQAAGLRASGLLASVISCGQAFGGDLEAVNVFTGLLAARHVAGADVAVVGDGPGNTGTATHWGSTSIASAVAMDAADTLGGRPIAALRISFADGRERHRGVSHHSITALTRVVRSSLHVAVPTIEDGDRRTAVWSALADAGIHERHRVVEANGRPALDLLAANGIRPDSMGRGIDDDPTYFLAAGAAGVLAGRMAAGDRAWHQAAPPPHA